MAEKGFTRSSAALLKKIFLIKVADWGFEDVIQSIKILSAAKDYTFALKVGNHLLKSSPMNFEVHFLIGQIHQNLREWQPAIEHYENALLSRPGNLEGQKSLALVRKKLTQAKQIPPIYFIGMQLTASDYIRDLIAFGLGLSVQHLSSGISNIDYNVLDLVRTRDFAESRGALAKDHLPPLPVNIFMLNKLFDKVWVHFRDPRSYLVSSCIYFSELRKRQAHAAISNLSFWWDYEDYFPRKNQISSCEFHALPLSERIDYQLKTGNFETAWIKMIDQWVKYSQDKRFELQFLFTTYEQFKTNEMAFVNQILDFYGVPKDYFEYPFSEEDLNGSAFGKTPKAGSPNFTLRRGSMTEWKEILSPSQIQQVQNMMPDYMFEMFAWERMYFN